MLKNISSRLHCVTSLWMNWMQRWRSRSCFEKPFYDSPILKGRHFCVFQLAIEKYEEMFPAFTDSRELKLLKVIHIYLFLICFRHALCHIIMRNKWNSNSIVVAHVKIYWSLEFGQKSLWSKYSNVKNIYIVNKSPLVPVSLQQKLLEAHEEQNSEAFTEAVKEFDSISRLDQWLTTMLLRIKKTIQGDGGDLK